MPPPRQIPRQTPRLRSPVARAVVPVVAGIAFFGLLAGITWLIALAVSGNEQGINIGDKEFTVGRADFTVTRIVEHGPLLFADLKGTAGAQAIVLDHDPKALDTEGWTLYFAYRADRGPGCLVEVDTTTERLKDCDGSVVTVADLEPAEPDAKVVVELGKRPVVKVRFAAAQPVPTTTSA